MIGLYDVHEKVIDINSNAVNEVKVVGFYLPMFNDILINMDGRWVKNDKHGTQFELNSYREVVQANRKGIVAYLSSGLIKGIGPKIAEKIYEAFGDQTLDILDSQPEKLKSISGISSAKLKQICESYLASRAARDVVTLLTPHGVTANRALKIFHEFGLDAVRIIRENPYKLCDMSGIGFFTADKIAVNMGLERASPFRVKAGLVHTLKEAETQGHLCMNKKKFIEKCVELLNTEGVDFKSVGNCAYAMLTDGELEMYGDQIFRRVKANAEIDVANRVNNFLSKEPIKIKADLDKEINLEEKRLGLKLAAEQRQAIKTCLTSRICIITGGPGTGKTLIQRVFLSVFKKLNSKAGFICCAPTGRAARRMEQSTGFSASTVHKALGLTAGDDENFNEPEMPDTDLVLVDEVSMVDAYLAKHLFNSVPKNAQLILVGDADQLPSVGPGAVLSELISCGRIPVVKLDKVFRQNEGSRIAVNAKLIRHNNLSLEYGDDFLFVESKNYADSANIIEQLFLTEASKVGLDNVALLTPFRTKTETGVNALNERLQGIINPPQPNKPEVTRDRRTLRLGDKVMQIKNRGDVNNGDVGYITDISKQNGSIRITVDYGDGRVSDYEDAEIEMLELAYAGTVHKSQGSEYASVIINIQNGHYIMLKRPLVYTAITRAKQRVIIVGERKALCIAINTVDTEKRGTMLAARIKKRAGRASDTDDIRWQTTNPSRSRIQFPTQ
jgi:exodeoxyribonuclease V alpha subunit